MLVTAAARTAARAGDGPGSLPEPQPGEQPHPDLDQPPAGQHREVTGEKPGAETPFLDACRCPSPGPGEEGGQATERRGAGQPAHLEGRPARPADDPPDADVPP